MTYLKTQRKNKRPGEYKPKVSRRNKDALALDREMDRQMMAAIERDVVKLKHST